MSDYAATPAAALFLAPAADRSGDLVAALSVSAEADLQIGVRVGGAVPKRNPDTGAELPLLPCPFAAIVLAQGSLSRAIATLTRLIDRTAPDVDLAASALLIGTEHAIMRGSGAILVTMPVRRRPDFTPASFRNRWLGEHAPFGLRIPVSGYRQLHADPTTFPGLPAGDRFDGAGTVLFRDIDHAQSARATPAITRDAVRDEMQFIDHAESMLAMFRLIG